MWTPYGYDNVGNLLSITYSNSHPITFQYDKLNRPTNMVDAVGSTSYAYDGVGQVLSEDGPWPSDTVTYTDLDQLRLGLSVQSPSGTAWSQSYCTSAAAAWSKSLRRPAPSATPTTRSAASGCARSRLPSYSYVTNTYDSVARLLSTGLQTPQSVVLDSHQYQYNAAGQRTRQTRLHGDYAGYTYDNSGQLKTALGLESGGATHG